MSETASTEVEKVQTALDKIASNKAVSLKDVVGLLAPEPERLPVPEVLPLPAVITKEQREALAHLNNTFGAVVPTERRALESSEIEAIHDERKTLDQIEKLASNRKADIRTAVVNHFDVIQEEAGDVTEETPRDKEGHYVGAKVQEPIPNSDKKWSWEIRGGSPELNIAELERLADDETYEGFTRKDFLAMTTQTRVVDENKVMLAMKKNPELVRTIAKATKTSAKTGSLFVR